MATKQQETRHHKRHNENTKVMMIIMTKIPLASSNCPVIKDFQRKNEVMKNIEVDGLSASSSSTLEALLNV